MKKYLPIIIIVLLFLGGAGLVLYPVVSSWYMGRHQGQVIADYDAEAAKLSQAQMEEELEKARRYNESLLGNVVLTDPFNAEGLEEQNTEYEDLLNIGGDGVMGSVEIPGQNIYLPIYHGTDSVSLEKGAGHLQNSSLPVGGKGTHAVISGHTALPTAELFTDLDQVEKGDVFYIHILKETLAYRVYDIETVLLEQVESLGIVQGRDLVTLVTCTPYGINSHRLLIHAERTVYDGEQGDQAAAMQKSLWQWLLSQKTFLLSAGLILIVLLYGIIRFIRRIRKNSRRKKEEANQ
ncbi:MAG TPA: class C sortase [Candidatus Anaerobutyricum avicola]|nr:class C sortase [Candidatus Anaerobutyricum avicola]